MVGIQLSTLGHTVVFFCSLHMYYNLLYFYTLETIVTEKLHFSQVMCQTSSDLIGIQACPLVTSFRKEFKQRFWTTLRQPVTLQLAHPLLLFKTGQSLQKMHLQNNAFHTS